MPIEEIRGVTSCDPSEVYLWFALCEHLKVKCEIYTYSTNYFALKAIGSEPIVKELIEKWNILQSKGYHLYIDKIVEQGLTKVFDGYKEK